MQLSAKFTTDVVAAVAFGLDGESFTNPNASFRQMGDDIFKPSFLTGLKQQIALFMPFLGKYLNIS
jgi:cytochrome P450 family 6